MEFIRKNTKLLFILVLPVYFYIVQSSILNKHSHFYANGLVITHSHSVDLNENEPINNHGHTQTILVELESDNIGIEQVVVSADRNSKSIQQKPTIETAKYGRIIF